MRFLSDEQYEDVLHVAGMMPHIVPTVTPHGEFVLFFNSIPSYPLVSSLTHFRILREMISLISPFPTQRLSLDDENHLAFDRVKEGWFWPVWEEKD